MSDAFVIGAADVLKATVKTNPSCGTYVVNKCKAASGEIWYGRAYLVYRDSSGNIVTITVTLCPGHFKEVKINERRAARYKKH